MDAAADPRYVAMFQRTWGPARALAARAVGEDRADSVTVEGFARTLERWHRLAARPDPDGKALGRTAEAAVRAARRQRSDDSLHPALAGMPVRVGVAFVLRYLGDYPDVAVASATQTTRRRARRRAERGLRILRRRGGPDADELVRA